MDKDCLFCKIINGEILAEWVFEDENFIAVVDIRPVNPGHILLIPKTHHSSLFDLPNNLLAKIGLPLQKLAIAVKKGVNADGINIEMNNDKAAGQLIFHQHTHIIPRFKGDGYNFLPHQEGYSDEDLKQIAEKIKNQLKN